MIISTLACTCLLQLDSRHHEQPESSGNSDTVMSNKLMSRRRASELGEVSIRTIYNFEKRGLLKPIKLNSRLVRYQEEEVLALFRVQRPTVLA